MKKILLFAFLMLLAVSAAAQNDTVIVYEKSSAERLLEADTRLTIGGYGQVDYVQSLSEEKRFNGQLDVPRLVILFAYRFDKRTQFITEIEYEHVKEVYIEQAFLQYKLNDFISFRGGLLLIPMGIINEYHEPTAFNGVSRPHIDNLIVPTTWREIGFGVAGTVTEASLRYQAYLLNGFSSYSADGKGLLSGAKGFRGGRQKGASSFISTPDFSARIEYFGLRGLTLGLSGYSGATESALYNNTNKNEADIQARADSSSVGLNLAGFDIRYSIKGIRLKGQYYYGTVSNSLQYNLFTAKAGVQNDLGKAMTGWYAEAAFDILSLVPSAETELVPFVRFEGYDTHHRVETGTPNPAYKNRIITSGIGWKMAKGAVVKVDMQLVKPSNASESVKTFNAGIGVAF